MSYLYEPKSETDYQGRIHSEDNMMITWSYQHIMDLAVANYGRPVTEIKLRKALKDQLDMAIEDMMECFELCKGKMLEELNKDYYNDDYIFKGIDKYLNKDLLEMDDMRFRDFLEE